MTRLANDEGGTVRSKQTPCKTCPFRSDVEFVLTEDKAEAIVAALQGDGDFPCHNTTAATGCTPGQEKGCIGAAIFLEHVRENGLRANLTFRLREQWCQDFNRESLDMAAPVFSNEDEFIAARTAMVPAD